MSLPHTISVNRNQDSKHIYASGYSVAYELGRVIGTFSSMVYGDAESVNVKLAADVLCDDFYPDDFFGRVLAFVKKTNLKPMQIPERTSPPHRAPRI